MTTTVASTRRYAWQHRGGYSDTFKRLGSAIEEIRRHEEESLVLGWRQELRDRLADVVVEASKEGWDGYHASPVSDLAIATARHLIDQLPETSPLPDIVPCPSGEIAFEWDRGKDYLFSITTAAGFLVFAGIVGPDRKLHGQEPWGDELPRSIASTLAAYFREP